MSSRNRFALVVDVTLATAAAALLEHALTHPLTQTVLPGLAFMTVSAVIMAGVMDYLLPMVGGEAVGVAISLASLMAIGPCAPVLLLTIPVLVAQYQAKLAPREFISRFSRVLVSIAAASAVYSLFGGQIGAVRWRNAFGVVGAVGAYFATGALLGLVRDGLPARGYRRWTRTQVGWAIIQGALMSSWAAIFHALAIAWGEGALVLVVPGVLSISILTLNSFYHARQQAVEQLANAVGQRNPLYPGHAERVLQYAEAIARELGIAERDLTDVRLAAMLCDVGQSKVPTDYALQARPLTEDERGRLAEHVLEGVSMISRIPALSHVASIVRAHHEWYNGLGYPDGLSGARIPIGARIIAVADAFTAMTSYRPYRRMMSAAEAFEVVEANSGGQFCPQAATGLKAYIRKSSGGSLPPRPVDHSEVGLTVHALRNYIGRAAAKTASVAGAAERDWVFYGLGALSDLMAIMTSSLDIDRVLDVATQIINGLTGAKCGVVLLGPDGEIVKAHGIPLETHLGKPANGVNLLDSAVEARAPMSLTPDEIPFQEMRDYLRKTGVRRLITVPLLCRGRAIGGAFIRMSQDRSFNDAELNMLMIVASQVALAVDSARLHSETATRLHEISEIQALNQWILENTSTGIIAIDADGIVTLISHPAVQILSKLGLVPPDGTGWSYPDWARRNGHDSHLVQCLHAGEGCDLYGTPLVGPNGIAYFHIHITVSRDQDGHVVGLTDIFDDVTEHRLMEQRILETEKLSALAQLAGGAAHEIRNPLASVRGFVQLMQRRQAAEDGMGDYMNIILSEIDRIDGIIRELLQLAKPAPPAMADLPLRRLLDEICLLMGTGATLHQVDLVRVFPGNLPILQGDNNQLKQVFINIITNAIQATPYGGRIVVDAGGDGGEAWVRISDTGEGIPPEKAQRIFEPFYTTKENGTGLGLTVCYSIVRAHGGRIDVDSEPGKGTTFTVRLPLAVATAKAI